MIARTVPNLRTWIVVQAGLGLSVAGVVMLAASASGPTTPLNGYDV